MMKHKEAIQFIFACIVIVAGITAMFMGFWTVPVGSIDPTVLTALGECLTFGGSVWGIERTYHYKTKKLEKSIQNKDKEDEQ